MEKIQRRITDKKGFTLIELVIVLVIIGIIFGAILKGGDVIEGARHKKLIGENKKWETLTWAFFDRKGHFQGDTVVVDGIIGNQTGENPRIDLTERGRFLDPPTTNSITMGGGFTFHFWFGNAGATRNVIGITSTPTPTAFTTHELAYMEAIDTSIDGVSDGRAGRVRATTDMTTTSATWLISGNPTSGVWDPGVTTALLYYFDRLP